MSKSVLCAVDVNERSDVEVLRIAAKLAKLDGARLDVIAVVPDYGMSMVADYFEKDFHDKAVERARAALHKFTDEALGDSGLEPRDIVATGKVYREILHAAKEAGSDLIVIGSHRPDFTDFVLGPNAMQVVRHAECSVYMVRLDGREG